MRTSLLNVSLALVLAGAAGPACAPKYPKCDRDEHCKPGELCVNGLCQQCRADSDCPHGQRCNKGRCEPKPECASDVDCQAGMKCHHGKCLARGCQTDSDCPPGQECQGGKCVAPPRPETSRAPCTPETIYFDFDEHVLTSDATKTLKEQVEPCLKTAGQRRARIEAHCDPRGTEEYNLALGDRRGQSIKRYLERLGVPSKRLRIVSKGKLEATGTDEAGWSKDRRAQFAWE